MLFHTELLGATMRCLIDLLDALNKLKNILKLLIRGRKFISYNVLIYPRSNMAMRSYKERNIFIKSIVG